MNRGLIVSTVLHAALFFAVLLGPAAQPFRWEPAEAIAVDLVAPAPEVAPELPRETVEPPPPTPPVEPEVRETPVEEVKPPEPQPVKSTKPLRQRVFRPLAPKKLESGPTLAERLQSKLEELEPEDEQDVPPPQEPPAATSSTEVEARDFPYAWYLNTLKTRITDSWDPPGTRMIRGRAKQVLVRLRVHRSGRVSDVVVEAASGTPGLDASARRAVDLAQPFAPLPEGYAEEVLDLAVRFTISGDAL